MKILAADDELTARLLLHRMLSDYGECHLASCGQEAWAVVKMAINQKKPFSLICLDINMPPGDNGLDLAKKIRGYEHDNEIFGLQRSKIMMVSAEDDRQIVIQSFLESECDGYLIKPIDPEKLEEKMNMLKIEKFVYVQ